MQLSMLPFVKRKVEDMAKNINIDWGKLRQEV